MNTIYCDYQGCSKRAAATWKWSEKDYDGDIEYHELERCADHVPTDERYVDYPIKQLPGQLHPVFAEALAPFMPTLVEARPHTFSVCCGSPVSDDGRCTSCWETVEVN